MMLTRFDLDKSSPLHGLIGPIPHPRVVVIRNQPIGIHARYFTYGVSRNSPQNTDGPPGCLQRRKPVFWVALSRELRFHILV